MGGGCLVYGSQNRRERAKAHARTQEGVGGVSPSTRLVSRTGPVTQNARIREQTCWCVCARGSAGRVNTPTRACMHARARGERVRACPDSRARLRNTASCAGASADSSTPRRGACGCGGLPLGATRASRPPCLCAGGSARRAITRMRDCPKKGGEGGDGFRVLWNSALATQTGTRSGPGVGGLGGADPSPARPSPRPILRPGPLPPAHPGRRRSHPAPEWWPARLGRPSIARHIRPSSAEAITRSRRRRVRLPEVGAAGSACGDAPHPARPAGPRRVGGCGGYGPGRVEVGCGGRG